MIWCPTFKKFSAILAVAAALALPACNRPQAAPRPVAWLVGGGDCAIQARLPKAPEKLAPTPIVLIPRTGCPPIREATVNIDMTNMKMNVAPITLKEQAGEGGLPEWHGELVFTMGGPWRIEAKVTDSQGTIHKGIKDVAIP